jgi:hypothetical protein
LRSSIPRIVIGENSSRSVIVSGFLVRGHHCSGMTPECVF